MSQAPCSAVRLTVSRGWGESHNPEIASIHDTASTQRKKRNVPALSAESRAAAVTSDRELWLLPPWAAVCKTEPPGGLTGGAATLFLRRAVSRCDGGRQVRCAHVLAEDCGFLMLSFESCKMRAYGWFLCHQQPQEQGPKLLVPEAAAASQAGGPLGILKPQVECFLRVWDTLIQTYYQFCTQMPKYNKIFSNDN